MKKFNLNLIPEPPVLERVDVNGLRHYRVGDDLYPSVTSVLSANEEKGIILEQWRARVGVEEADRVSRHAAYQGTVVHTLIEDHILGRPTTIKTAPHHHSMANRLKVAADNYIDNIRAVELRMYSTRTRSAGTVDLIAEFDGELAIIDWKTSKQKKKHSWITDYFKQESAYGDMFEERYGEKIKKLVTIITTSDGNTQIFIESPKVWFPEYLKLRSKFYAIHGS